MSAVMVRSLIAGTPRRGALLWVLAGAAVLALTVAPAFGKSAHVSGPSFYVVKSAKAKCKKSYTKQTVTLKVRKHRRWVHVHQVRCVYTGSGTRSAGGGGGGGGGLTFPLNLPTAAISVTVIPTAVADSYDTVANQSLAVSTDAGVLANDDGLGLSATLVAGAAHGTVTLTRNGAFNYVPSAGYSGIDHFDYRDTDGSGESSAPARVTIFVTPVAAAPSSYSVGAASTLNVGAPGLLAGAVGSGLHAQLEAGAGGGSVTVNADGSFSYTGAAGFAGVDSFQFDVVDADGQASDPVTVTIDVGAAPPTPVAETFTGAVGNTELQVGGVRGGGAEVYQGGGSALAGDSDPNGGTLSTTPASIQTAQGGSVALAANGSFTYQPPPGFSGPGSDSFSYQVDTSEGTSAQATATIDFTGARVWYVDQSAAPGGTGTSASPFNSLAPVSAPSSSASAGDVIFVFPGSYAGGVTLAPNQALLGAPAGLTVSSEDLLDPTGSNPVITNAGGPAVSLVDGDTLSAVAVSASPGAGILVTNANTFTITQSVTVTSAGADGIDINGGSGAASVEAAISGSAGYSVKVQSRGGGTLVFGGAISDNGGNGVLLQSNPGTTINFTGTITSATTNSHPAFQALGGGTVTATSAANTLSSAGAAALDVESTAIGSGGLHFQSISAGTGPGSGPADGVILLNTGTAGALNVTGTGSAGSGGTIQGTTTAALSLSNSGAVALSHMLLEPASGDGVAASAVPALQVLYSTITGGGRGIAASGDASTQLAPQTFDIEQDTLSGQTAAAMSLTYAGTTTGYVLANTIGSESPVLAGSTSGDGIDISPSSAGTITAQIANNGIFQIHQGNGIDAQAPTGALLNLTLNNNTVQMDSASSQDGVVVGSTGSVCLNPTGNVVVAAGSSASDNAIEVDQLGSASVFQIQGYGGASDASGVPAVEAFLSGANTFSVGVGGGGSAAVAAPDGSNGFSDAPGPSLTCPSPPPNGGAI
ncbi:MAG TPA: Ig-like domain-containing protein [Solirubrobacteraceae bacterium]|nr:Ig-like domain-containing protein [Solirubrobacteraceae bacterium]